MASLHTLRHQRRRLSGGELPPTPPAHSRTSSSSKSINLPNISPLHTPAQSSEDVQTHISPSTPVNQRSPPTPEVTPPRAGARSQLLPERPAPPQRRTSKSTTTDSRTESFRTALESPEPSEEDEEEDSNSTLRVIPLERTSDLTVRRLNRDESNTPKGAVLGAGTKSKHGEEAHDLTPRASKSEFHSFDGDWGAESEVEQEWDDNLARTVTVKKRPNRTPRPISQQQRQEIVDDKTVSPTNATKAVRGLPLQGRILTYDHPELPFRSFTAPETAITEAPVRPDDRRLSGMSMKSTASTTVEAILVSTPPLTRRNRTLRHVKRVNALRDWQSPPPGPVRKAESPPSQTRRVIQPREALRESYASNSTMNSISSRKARKEIIKSGAIPVVVVPDRHSSTRSTSQDRSVPSNDSQRSRRSQSIKSVPLSQVSKTHDLTPYFERPSRRSRRTSESDGSLPGDQRTMDFPPVVPRRTSSLSAPTSRSGSRRTSINGSHSGSLTAASLKALNDSVVSHKTARAPRAVAGAVSSPTEASVPTITADSVPSYNQFKPNVNYKVDTLLGSPRLASQNTPFSSVSVETSGTAAEISEAMAMSIDRHQNKSVLMVDHRPSESSDRGGRSGRPTIITTDANGWRPVISSREVAAHDEPITPPQAHPPFSLNDVDSPLRNPRVPPTPPQPPVLQFTAATPSGLTPAEERPMLLGNFYEVEEEEEKPSRGLAMVRRALNKHRNSYGPSPTRERPGFLTRTLSLTRTGRKGAAHIREAEEFGQGNYDDQDYDDSHLHPDWRPSYHAGIHGAGEMFDYSDDDAAAADFGYPMIDNRPRPPKRSLSQRMKHTFAIMPTHDPYHDNYDHDHEPERRTIRRDPHNGSLRVVKKRGSVGSLREAKARRRAPDAEPQRTPVFPRKFHSLAKLRRRGSEDSETTSVGSKESGLGLRRTWSLTQGMQGLSRRVSERRREKRSVELRAKIGAPTDCRDGVEDVIRRDGGMREAYEGRV